MPISFLMPALSPTMTEGKVARWHKKEGDPVTSGDVVCEVETDKATMEVEAVEEGTLGKILVPAGTEGVAVNTVIALILAEGEDKSALSDFTAAPTPVVKSAPTPKPAEPKAPPVAKVEGARLFSSPIARRIAAQGGLDLAGVKGSGPHGRIVKRDVEQALASGVRPVKTPSIATPSAEPTLVPHTTMRKVIAKRLTQSKQTVPHFYLTVDCRIDALLAARKEINAHAPDGVKLSVNDFVIKAVALALRKVPEANVSWTDDAMVHYNTVDISVAVATPGGLITPVLRHADHKGLAELSAEVKELAGRAKDGKLSPEEYQGGGFTISNLGMYGIDHFAAIINPPQACILAVGAGVEKPVAVDGQLAVATVMSCTLSVDHRAVDGAVGARFMGAFRTFIEHPSLMLL
ncbi:MAG: pyruvate dehydrogenase complex dihydrolipoamide acetyltransferase [Alphaproteobacteria bacterium RIFOXYD12_FULL_60_8]|nr:MAG: pyruvate dehydrogenase complex dihydrolipoamide acetyltransferase [Alphaproteobacteria bacterium RIFOXYD12_FULL_60_8]